MFYVLLSYGLFVIYDWWSKQKYFKRFEYFFFFFLVVQDLVPRIKTSEYIYLVTVLTCHKISDFQSFKETR